VKSHHNQFCLMMIFNGIKMQMQSCFITYVSFDIYLLFGFQFSFAKSYETVQISVYHFCKLSQVFMLVKLCIDIVCIFCCIVGSLYMNSDETNLNIML
jgi:hypothetical protein